MSPAGTRRASTLLVALLSLLFLAAPGALGASDGRIDHAESRDGTLRVLFSMPGLEAGIDPDLESLEVDLDGTPVEATSELAASAETEVRRTTVLAIDTSKSMLGERFKQAKAAARAFLEGAPANVFIGIVTFDSEVRVAQAPTLDRDAALAVVDGLTLRPETRLYDGVMSAVEATGAEGQRSVLVLSDGRDTSERPLADVVGLIRRTKVRVDVVAVGEATQAVAPLQAMAEVLEGQVFPAQNPEAIIGLFADEAASLARQVLVTAPIPESLSGDEGSLSVSVAAGEETYSDTAFVSFGRAAEEAPAVDTSPQPVPAPSVVISPELLWGAFGAVGLAVLLVLMTAFGVFGRRQTESVEDKISAYTRAGAAKNARAAAAARTAGASSAQGRGVTESAVGLAQKALEGNRGFEAKLGNKLDGADLAMKPAEWLLMHAAIAFVAGIAGLLFSSGGIALTLVFFLLGAVGPWLYLGIRKSRRLKAFNGQLAETLQLIAGSLSAGLSLAQSLDTVVREGSDPIASEFRRALVEARLGVAVEDSLDSIAKRMDSDDFEWIVMAIRIQREVGGNLAELLLKVAGTMRERDYLRRQVKTLSAEGKMSGWILGALPPGMFFYMLVSNGDYVRPMYTTPMGWVMLAAGVVLLALGAFWMSRVVKVDV